MSAAPEGFAPPSAEDFAEWSYRYLERLGIMAGKEVDTHQQRARASFEADRALEALTGREWSRGWIAKGVA